MLSVGISYLSLARPQIGHRTRWPWACSCLSAPLVLVCGDGMEEMERNGQEGEYLTAKKNFSAAGGEPAGLHQPWRSLYSEQVTELDLSPGTSAAISINVIVLGRAPGWKMCTTVKCDSAVPWGSSLESAEMRGAISGGVGDVRGCGTWGLLASCCQSGTQ